MAVQDLMTTPSQHVVFEVPIEVLFFFLSAGMGLVAYYKSGFSLFVTGIGPNWQQS